MNTIDELLASPAPFKEWLAQSEWVAVEDWYNDNPLARFLREKADVAAALVILELPEWAKEFNRTAHSLGYTLEQNDCISILGSIEEHLRDIAGEADRLRQT